MVGAQNLKNDDASAFAGGAGDFYEGHKTEDSRRTIIVLIHQHNMEMRKTGKIHEAPAKRENLGKTSP
jgi:hypothetical protein